MNVISEYNNHTALYVKFCGFRVLFFAIRISYSIMLHNSATQRECERETEEGK